MLDAGATAMTWVALVGAVLIVLSSAWWLRRGSSRRGGRNGQLAMLLFALVVLLNTVPRLAGASSALVLILSTLAFLPLVGFLVLIGRTGRT